MRRLLLSSLAARPYRVRLGDRKDRADDCLVGSLLMARVALDLKSATAYL